MDDTREAMAIDNTKRPEDAPKIDIVHVKATDAILSQPTANETSQLFSLERIVLLFIVLIQIWILLELRGLKRVIGILEQQQSLANSEHSWEGNRI
jgi:hypothetical protein